MHQESRAEHVTKRILKLCNFDHYGKVFLLSVAHHLRTLFFLWSYPHIGHRSVSSKKLPVK
jgi:hypothetical protein